MQGGCTRTGTKRSQTGGWISPSPASPAGVYLTAALLVHTAVTALGSSELSTKGSVPLAEQATSLAGISSMKSSCSQLSVFPWEHAVRKAGKKQEYGMKHAVLAIHPQAPVT